MSKNQAAPLAGGKPLSHARGANPPLIPPETCGEHDETAQPWPPGAPGYGEKTSISAMAAQGARQPHVSYMPPAYEAGQHARRREGHAIRGREAAEQSAPGHGAAGDITQSVAARPRPSYVPPAQRRREQPPRPPTEPPPAEAWAAPSSPPYAPPPQMTREEPPRWNIDDRTPPRRGRITAATAGGEAPPRRVRGLPDPEPVVLYTTLGQADFSSTSPPPPHPQRSPARAALGKRKPSAAALCFTACCILFWLLAIAVGLVLLVIYLRYRPQPPRMRVAAATLNGTLAGGGGGGAALSSYSLAVEADIYNPNTKLHVVLRYMRLDLYFHGSLVGTQAVTQTAPLREGPGDSERRVVQLVIGMSQEQQDVAAAWQNATTSTDGAPVVLRLVGRFHAQLNFGRWLPFRFWTYPRCTLWLDPPPGGALRGSKC